MKIPDKIRIPIVVKLVGVTIILLLAATGTIAYVSSTQFQATSLIREKEANSDNANAMAAQLNLVFDKYRDKIRIVSSSLFKSYATEEEKNLALQSTFYEDPELISVQIVTLEAGKQVEVAYVEKADFLAELNLTTDYLRKLRSIKPFPVANIFARNVEIRNSSLPSGAPLVTMGVPIKEDSNGVISHVAIADLKLDGLQKPFSKISATTFYLVDKDGTLMAHPDDKLVFEGKSLKDNEFVDEALKSKNSSEEKGTKFEGVDVTASYSKTQYGPMVIAQTPIETIIEPAKAIQNDAFFITGMIVSGAIFFIFIFSITLTDPIERLVEVTRQVAGGNFEVHVNIKSHDEVGELARSFDSMVDGLKERDKVKNVLNKFHGSTVADDLLKGDLQLGGKKRDVTILFSDIRDFTKFSEGHTPEEVVMMLNEYFEIMVDIVTRNHGVVDKFIGDAMMAIWGAPNTTGTDEVHAVKSCLEMRQALEALNALRISRGQVEIKFGIGINSGAAIAGTIGSSQRMEYTVIGDSVNTASRIESSTKAFGTDLLISGETLEKVKDKFVIEYAGAAEVKGKAEPLKMYKVKGFIGENGEQILIQTKYSDYEAGHDAKVKIAG